MDSVNRQHLRARIAGVVDTSHAAQAQSKDINKHLKELRKAGELKDGMASAKDFMRDIGSI